MMLCQPLPPPQSPCAGPRLDPWLPGSLCPPWPPPAEEQAKIELIRRGLQRSDRPLNVQILELIGEGSFGRVYRGE